mmetsp:Transcript_12766/g.51313  ORF Transcript_12766/g.51313 Transcript_12766/m.51313 type:complete len:374 (-) Transcript_12766:1709-2830(-)
MMGRNLALPPVATPPSATDAADLSSSPGASSAPSSAASMPATADKSAAFPSSPRQKSAGKSFSVNVAGSPSCFTSAVAVADVCFASFTPAHTAATQTAAVRPATAAASPSAFNDPPPATPPAPDWPDGSISLSSKSSAFEPGRFAATRAAKNDVSAWSACDCISGERTSSSAAGSVLSQTAARAFGKRLETLTEDAASDSADPAMARSPSVTSAAASTTAAVTSASLSDPECFDTSASSAPRLACRSGRFVLRRKPASASTAEAAASPTSRRSSDLATRPIALTAASLVISFLSLSRSRPRHRFKSDAPMTSPSVAAAAPAHEMAASFTSWSWSVAPTRDIAASANAAACHLASLATMGTSALHARSASAATL